jgi:fatty-acyl-CoA synthase
MKVLLKLNILGIKRIFGLLLSICKHGFNLLVLLDSVKEVSVKEAYVEDDFVKLSYHDLYVQSLAMASHLQTKYKIKPRSKIVIVSANSVSFVKSLFSVSSLGTDIFLLNPNQKKDYYDFFFATNKIDLIIGEKKNGNEFRGSEIPFFCYNEKIDEQDKLIIKSSIKWKSSNLIILSSGSKGKPKNEKRKVSALKYLNPLTDIVEKLHLRENKSVLISAPIFHGYGLAALFLSIFMVQKIRLTDKFDSKKTLELLNKENLNCWIAVPLMIQKVYSFVGIKPNTLKSIISGGDVLPYNIVEVIHRIGTVKVYNMYGTSETGVCTIATDEDLYMYPDTIGKVIVGVKTKIIDANGDLITDDKVGRLCVKCGWSSDNKMKNFEPTGDLVSKNKEGYYFYKGRNDDLMIIGGENIYPLELENTIYKNPKVKWVKAKSVVAESGIFKIHIDLVVDQSVDFCEYEFRDWISKEVPKYMIPKSMDFLNVEPALKLM